jgi:hypothetical protein
MRSQKRSLKPSGIRVAVWWAIEFTPLNVLVAMVDLAHQKMHLLALGNVLVGTGDAGCSHWVSSK